MKESLSFESFFESFEQVNSGNKYLLAIAENLSEEDRQKVILELKPFGKQVFNMQKDIFET